MLKPLYASLDKNVYIWQNLLKPSHDYVRLKRLHLTINFEAVTRVS